MSVNIEAAFEKAVAFLLHQRVGSAWTDFDLAPGSSDEWVTAYVSKVLAELPDNPAADAVEEAWLWLLSRRRAGEGWGYNRLTPRDADSTIWALQLAEQLGYTHWSSSRQAQAFLAQHVQPCGGVVTYCEEAPIRRFVGAPDELSFAGWCQPQVCVTAAAASLPHFFDGTVDYLRQTQVRNGRWCSYWWMEDAYATTLAVEALAQSGAPSAQQQVNKAVAWGLEQMTPDGFVPSWTRPNGSTFATALVVRLLLHCDDPQRVAEKVSAGVRWLLTGQQESGGWSASAGLRVPYPDMHHPEEYEHWLIGHPIEGGVSLDQNGVFTTATAVSALLKFRHWETCD
ncbi:MAG: prenyltransferase/squalene oxidase repeat-containing protein [Chloroflexota bacterium]